MFTKLVVPVDLSHASFDVVPIAARMAAAVGVGIDVITVVDRLADVPLARGRLERGMERVWPLAVEPQTDVHADSSVVDAVVAHLDRTPGSMLAMSSHGHGRTAAVLGSTAEEFLRAIVGPVIVIGPQATDGVGAVSGPYVVPLDGSPLADEVLPIVEAWATEFGGTPWLVEVADRRFGRVLDGERPELSFVHRCADDLQRQIGRPVGFEVLHGLHAAEPIVEFAESQNATLIFMSTHGRTGFDRLVAGSVASDVVRHSYVPVVMIRPAMLAVRS